MNKTYLFLFFFTFINLTAPGNPGAYVIVKKKYNSKPHQGGSNLMAIPMKKHVPFLHGAVILFSGNQLKASTIRSKQQLKYVMMRSFFV